MSARPQDRAPVAERLHGHLEPTPGGSVYLKPADMDWKPSQFEGIDIKVLYEDKARGEMTCLLRWQPGTTLPFHKHPEIEQTYVISGSFSDHDGIARAGENPLFAKVVESQKAWAKRVMYWHNTVQVDQKAGYAHHFGKGPIT